MLRYCYNFNVLLGLWCVATACLAQTDQISQTNNTPTINVAIDITPYKDHYGTIYVAANTDINISAQVSGSGFNESNLIYNWATKEGDIKSHDKLIQHKFTQSEDTNFVSLKLTDPPSNTTISVKKNVTVKSPVVVLDPIGKLFLERGELLEISLRYTGSPPYKYCYKICSPWDVLPCNYCYHRYETTNTVIPVIYYIHDVGNYTLLFEVENMMNSEEKHYAIKINESVRNRNLPIAPIVSTILAVIILMTGVALHLKFRDRSYSTETANFDFFNDNDDDDWEQEFSFIQRVKYLFCGLTEQDDDEEVRHLIRKSSATPSYSSSGHGTNITSATVPTDD